MYYLLIYSIDSLATRWHNPEFVRRFDCINVLKFKQGIYSKCQITKTLAKWLVCINFEVKSYMYYEYAELALNFSNYIFK